MLNDICTIRLSKDGNLYAIFASEEMAEKYQHLFVSYVRYVCFGGYLNALQLTGE